MINTNGVNNQIYYQKPLNTNPALSPAYYNGTQQRVGNGVNNGNSGSQLVSPSKLNTDAVYKTWVNPKATAPSPNDARLTILHINDNHRKVRGMAQAKTAIDQITAKLQGSGYGFLKVHSGDYNVGVDHKKFKVQVELLNALGIDFATPGNHEFDPGTRNYAELLKAAKFKTVTANLKIPQGCGLDELQKAGKIADSSVYESNGHKFGIVGMCPLDLKATCDPKVKWEGVDVLPEAESIKRVQEEVNKLKSQGINKIILLSHAGADVDRKVARAVDGIDIILGGHTHDLLKPLENGVSILESASKEPVLHFMDGHDGKNFGVTDATFDQNGIVKTAIARQEKTDRFAVNASASAIEDKILGKSPVIGKATSDYSVEDIKLRENPIANFVADAIKAKCPCDAVLLRSSMVRDDIKQGDINERFIEELAPFTDAMHIVRVSGQDIVEALSHGAQSFVRKDKRPGIMQVSGLKYTVNEDCKATNVMIQDKNGTYVPINPAKEYDVAVDQFTVKGGDGYKTLGNPLGVVRAYYDSLADVLKSYIKENGNRPLDMKVEGRINLQSSKAMEATKHLDKPVKSVINASNIAAEPKIELIAKQPVPFRPQMQTPMMVAPYQMMPPAYFYPPQFMPVPQVMPGRY